MKLVYFDNAATTKTDEKVVEAMMPYLTEKFGNPSSQHFVGQEAKQAIEEARKIIAKSINAKTSEIVFTSGGTESNNLALKGLFFNNYPKKNHIITTKIEHDCILKTCSWLEKQGAKITYLDVNKEGFIDVNQLKESITDKTILVSVIHGNNEIGTIQELETIGKICKERNIRSGTENPAGIIGFAKAVDIVKSKDIKQMTEMRDKLIEGILKISNTKLSGPRNNRLCNNINISFMNIEGEAIGLTPLEGNSSLRISISKYTTEEEVDYFLKELPKIVTKLRRLSPLIN